jgi:hypothetical protein
MLSVPSYPIVVRLLDSSTPRTNSVLGLGRRIVPNAAPATTPGLAKRSSCHIIGKAPPFGWYNAMERDASETYCRYLATSEECFLRPEMANHPGAQPSDVAPDSTGRKSILIRMLPRLEAADPNFSAKSADRWVGSNVG